MNRPGLSSAGKFVVVGHLCLDLAPTLSVGYIPEPGGLAPAGPLRISMGGAVPNVGSALFRLGHEVALVARVGDDWLSKVCMQLLEPLGPQPGLRIAAGQHTSYSIVIAPRGRDRAFLHYAGANVTFVAADLREADLEGAGWLHFGYPPMMPAMAANEGAELAKLFRRAARRGIRSSLDFCALDPSMPPVDWEAVLRNCANFITLFAPSIEEMRSVFGMPSRPVEDISDVRPLAHRLLNLGFPVVAIKLGANGLYLATTASAAALRHWKVSEAWRERELLAPCFQSNFVNASGSGDCAIAGLCSAIARGADPEEALTMGVATGASSTEAEDASGGVMPLAEMQARIEAGWGRLPSTPPDESWHFDPVSALWAPIMAQADSSGSTKVTNRERKRG